MKVGRSLDTVVISPLTGGGAYEPVVRRRYPDLIAILPEVGVLVIEVKDWRLAELGGINADTVTITRRFTSTVRPL